MKIARILLLALLCCLALPAAMAQEAADITKSCTLTSAGKGKGQLQRMRDRDYDTGMKLAGGKELLIESREPVSGVMIKYYLTPVALELQAERDGAWEKVADLGLHLSDWVAVPEGTTRLRLLNGGETSASVA